MAAVALQLSPSLNITTVIIAGGAYMGKQTSLEGMTDGVYIVQQGAIVAVLQPKEFGQDSIQWQHKRVFEVNEMKRTRIGASKK